DRQIVALHDVRYLEEKDDISYECLQAMKYNETWDYTHKNYEFKERHLRSSQEMEIAFTNFPEGLIKTKEIVEKCHVTFDFNKQLLPSFPVPENETAHTFLEKMCMQQLHIKYNQVTEKVTERLTHELQIIEQLGFSDYFLIV